RSDQRRLDLVVAADQHFGALDALVHLDDVGRGVFGLDLFARDGGAGGGLVLVLGGDDGVALDFLVDLDGHEAFPGIAVRWMGGAGVAALAPCPSPADGRGEERRAYFFFAALRGAAFFAAFFGAA